MHINIFRHLFFCIAAVAVFAPLSAQNVLAYEDYLEIVREHHPLSVQAGNQLKRGDAQVLRARGGFDPKLFSETSQKYFKDTRYYSIIESGLKIPTWFGVELQGGYDLTDGAFLNPQNTTPDDGLWYGGVSVTLGQGLFIDKRRAELKKAKIARDINELERQIMINELIFESGKAYWKWFSAYNVLQTYEEAVELARERYEGVRRSAEVGERPAIDTVEAKIQVQNNQINLNQSRLEYDNATQLLSVYLWLDGNVPLEISPGTAPLPIEEIPVTPVDELFMGDTESLIDQHPKLQQNEFKIDQLSVDRRWKREQLKPEVNVKYNFINETLEDSETAPYSINNYTWGLKFGMPLFLRKERAEVRLANLKISDAELELANFRANLKYKARAALNEWENATEQIVLYLDNVENSRIMLEGERRLFNIGESSLFLVNVRQMSFVSTRIKLVESIAKNQVARLNAYYTLGIPQ